MLIYLAVQDVYEIPIKSLIDRLWFNTNNTKYLKTSLKKLVWAVVEFNLLWKDKTSYWGASSLLASVEFRKWICYYSFSPLLRQKLFEPNIYTKINLNLVKIFNSKYALALFELMIDYEKIFQTPFISIWDIKKLLWAVKGYDKFKKLNAKVIKPAIKEIENIWEIKISCEYKKVHNKIEFIKFLIHKKQKNKSIPTPNTQLCKNLVENFGLTLKQANDILKKYPIAYINETLEIVKSKRASKLIKNIPAYTITILKNDYTPLQKISSSDVSSLENKSLPSTNTSSNQQKIKSYFEKLDNATKQNLIKDFEDTKLTTKLIKDMYQKKWLENPIFQAMFFGYLSQKEEIKL